MTQSDVTKIIEDLHSAGYAVIIWTPEELGDVPADLVEDRSIEEGHQIIADLQEGYL